MKHLKMNVIFFDTMFDQKVELSEKINPHLHPWSLPQSILEMDNTKYHMIQELEDALHHCGARLIFFPP